MFIPDKFLIIQKDIMQKIVNIGHSGNSDVWGILKSLNEDFNDINLTNDFYVIGRNGIVI